MRFFFLFIVFVSTKFIINFNTTYESCSVKRGLNPSAKSFDSCQPAQYAQSDIGRNFSSCQRIGLPRDTVGC